MQRALKTSLNPALGTEPPIQLFRIVLVLATHLRTRMDQRLASIHLTTQQAAVLGFVSAANTPPTLGDLAAALGTSHQSARQIVAALERKELLAVSVDPSDRRARRLRVTPAVERLFAERDPTDHHEVEQWMSVLTPTEQRMAVDLLHRVLIDLTSQTG